MKNEDNGSMRPLEERFAPEEGQPAPEDEYGNIHNPKKHLLTGVLYTVAMIAVIAAAAFITRLLG